MTTLLWKTKTARVFLTFTSVFLCHLSFPGAPFPALALVCLVPLGFALHDAPPIHAMLYSFLFGFFSWLGSVEGLGIGLMLYVQLSGVEALFYIVVFCLYLSIPYMLFGILYGAFQWMKHPLGPYKTAACLSILVSFYPAPLPFSPAHFLYDFPLLIQILDLGGEPLLLFVLCLFNWLLVDLIQRFTANQNLKTSLAAILALFISIPAYGFFRLENNHHIQSKNDATDSIKIATIQPNIPLPNDVAPHSGKSVDSLAILLDLSSQILKDNLDTNLVVWPETPDQINCDNGSKAYDQILNAAKYYKTAFLVNCVQQESNDMTFNTALLVNSNGKVSAYHKQRLLPFAEYLPGEKAFPFLRAIMPGVANLAPGKDKTVFKLYDKFHVFAAICYEVLFSDHVRAFIELNGNLIVSPANDAWFGNSRIPQGLVSSSIYRAIEYRVPLVRVSNSGNSLVVTTSGEIAPGSRTKNFKRDTDISEVFVPQERSPYFHFGDTFLYILTFFWVLGLWRNVNKNQLVNRIKITG